MNVRNIIDTTAHAVTSLNTTNLRIYTTLICVLWVTAWYTCSKWVPNDSFLMFLVALSASDVGQYWVKRSSTFPPNMTNGSTATTDCSEINKG